MSRKPTPTERPPRGEGLIEWARATQGEAFVLRVLELADEVLAGRMTTEEAAWTLHAERASNARPRRDWRGQ